MYRWAKHAALLLLAACEDRGDQGCTLIGCDSGVGFSLGAFPQSDFSRLTGARIEVCLNSMCRDAMLDVLPPPNDITYLRLGTPVAPRIEVTLARTAPSGAIEIRIDVESDQPELFHDGDLYTVALVDADGGQLVDRSWSVSYRTWQPNGPDCEPTCRSATTVTEL